MTLRAVLQDFRGLSYANDAPERSNDALESARAAGFETGYASGWEDASKSVKNEHQKIDAEFARNLQDLGFTFHEAASRVRAEAVAVIDQIVESFLPDVLPMILRETVHQHIIQAIDDRLDVPVQITTSTDGHARMSELLDRDLPFEIELAIEESLAAHQVVMKFGTRETDMDFTQLLDVVKSQLAAISENQDLALCHGR